MFDDLAFSLKLESLLSDKKRPALEVNAGRWKIKGMLLNIIHGKEWKKIFVVKALIDIMPLVLGVSFAYSTLEIGYCPL